MSKHPYGILDKLNGASHWISQTGFPLSISDPAKGQASIRPVPWQVYMDHVALEDIHGHAAIKCVDDVVVPPGMRGHLVAFAG